MEYTKFKGVDNMNTRLKKLRLNLNLSQEAFGRKLGVGKTAISKLELGENKISEPMIKLICKEFNVSSAWLKAVSYTHLDVYKRQIYTYRVINTYF